MIIRIDYPEPQVRLDLWGGTFAALDQFNRIVDQRWQNDTSGTPSDIDRYQYGYDRHSSRTWKANVVGITFTSCAFGLFVQSFLDHPDRPKRR